MVYPLSVVKQTGLFQDVRPCGVPLGDNRVHEGHLTGGRAPFVMPAPPEQTRDPGNTSGGAEGTRTPDPLVANSAHGGRPGASEHGSGRSKAREPCRSQWRCCTSLLYFSALRTERPDLPSPRYRSKS